ncbi:MAG: hypothetical protein IJ042_00190 [Butyricicoccus sp.]|nr:hypothetical protein [Butyricicoccus sp.]
MNHTPPIGAKQVTEAACLLERYRQGKQRLDRRILEDERWYRLRCYDGGRREPDDPEPASAWLFNSLMNKHGDMMDNLPVPNVLPREEGDRKDAEMLTRVLPVIFERSDFETVYSRNTYPKLQHGTACYGVFWDKNMNGGAGDIRIADIDVLNLFWEPGVRDIQDSRSVFLVTYADNDLLDAAYPALRGKLRAAMHTQDRLRPEAAELTGKSAVVDWYYKKFDEEGRATLHYCKFVGTHVLYASENDPDLAQRGFYDHARYPFVLDVLFPIAGSPAGFGYIDIMKSPQRYIDLLDEIILRNARLAGKPRWFYRDSCGVNEQEFADWSRDFVHVAGRLEEGDLRQITVNPLPAFITNHRLNKVAELKETSGNRDFSQGGVTQGVTAASAITALQEAGSKLSRDCIRGTYRAYTAICQMVIELMRQFYDGSRAFRVLGADGGYEFLPAPRLLENKRAGFDVEVRAEKAAPQSRLARNELAKELYQMGFFRPELAKQALMALEMMDFEGIAAVRARIEANTLKFQSADEFVKGGIVS